MSGCVGSGRGRWDSVECHGVKRGSRGGDRQRKMDGGTRDATRGMGTTGGGVVVLRRVGRRGRGVRGDATGTGGRRRRGRRRGG